MRLQGKMGERGANRKLPFVSVIVPVYNRQDMIGECISALLDQDYPRDLYEVIIVDNDSTDGTAEAIKRCRVQYVLEAEIHTSYAARNTGARHAKGEALAFCDSDQVAPRQWLRELLSHWEEGAYAGFVGPTPVRAIGNGFFERCRAIADETEGFVQEGVFEMDAWGAGNLCVRAADFRAVGGFRESLATLGDFDFCGRLRQLTGRRYLYIGTAVQYHRARKSLRDCVRQHFRLGYGAERFSVQGGNHIKRGLLRTAVLAASSWLRLPLLVPKILMVGAETGRKIALVIAVVGTVNITADLLGRVAYRIGLPERIVRGM